MTTLSFSWIAVTFAGQPTAALSSYGPILIGDGDRGAFPSWFVRITCDRCGKVQIVNEAHVRWRDRTLRQILARMRHDGCGGLAGRAELVTGADSASSRPARKIVLRE